MERLELRAEKRSIIGKKVKRLRREGLIPAVLYGHKTASIPLQVKERELRRVLSQAGGHMLISLKIEGEEEPRTVLVHEIQKDAITGGLLHADFYQVITTEKVTAEVPLVFVGEAPALLGGEAVLVHGLETVEVECLPDNLIESIEVDVSGLKEIGQAIYVRDLKVPPDIKILTDGEERVVEIVRTAPEEEVEEEAEEG